jgi:WXG100 family type VII secretion target
MHITVNFPAMQQAVEDVRSCHNALVREKADLDGFLATLRGTWHGTAGTDWRTTQQHWNTAADEVQAILLHLNNALEVALHNYTKTERALEQVWGG